MMRSMTRALRIDTDVAHLDSVPLRRVPTTSYPGSAGDMRVKGRAPDGKFMYVW